LPTHPVQQILLTKVMTKIKVKEGLFYRLLSDAKQGRHIIQQMDLELKKQSNYKNLYQLRHSVVMNWIKRHNLRQVQYNSGHRYISTTEKYLESDYEPLRLLILEKHPMI
ncbi:MAG: hypothetical protein KDC84_08015, partial [Crocinitomicaceae bacterium]|nr:hypothetical protein [Crocinitomicaceae bacterium]